MQQNTDYSSTTANVKMPTNDRARKFRSGSKRLNKSLPPLPGTKSRPNLAVDTSFTRNGGRTPQQLYPAPSLASRTRENFLQLEKMEGLSQVKQAHGLNSRKSGSEEAPQIHLGPQKSVAGSYSNHDRPPESACAAVDEAPPPYQTRSAGRPYGKTLQPRIDLQDPPSAKRNKRFKRPVLPNITTGVSPSDRAIPIGIALPSAAIRKYESRLKSTTQLSKSSAEMQTSPAQAQMLTTPTIVITPAEDDFQFEFDCAPLPADGVNGPRPRSSVYSRRTTCFSVGIQQHQNAPPVPPLPNFAVDGPHRSHNRTLHDSSPDDYVAATSATSIRSACEPMSSEFQILTPRRSRGWWNVITSPFIASSAMKGVMSPSSPVEDTQADKERLPQDAFEDAGQTGILRGFPDGTTLRSTSLSGRQKLKSRGVLTPKRSDTAPGSLDMCNAHSVNIYRIPSYGEAAAYYDLRQNFPSPVASPAIRSVNDRLEPGWSPSQSVYRESAVALPRQAATSDADVSGGEMQASGAALPFATNLKQLSGGEEASLASRNQTNYRTRTGTASEQGVVMAPADSYAEQGVVDPVLQEDRGSDEDAGTQPLREQQLSSFRDDADSSDVTLDQDVYPSGVVSSPDDLRNDKENATTIHSDQAGDFSSTNHMQDERNDQMWSPLSASPVYETAQAAKFVGTPAPIGHDPAGDSEPPAKDEPRDFATVEDSEHGNDEEKNRGAFFAEADNAEMLERGERHNRSCSRRFSVLLAGSALTLLTLLIVLLVMFVPLHHSDIAVQAEWLNLTGFPPLPTGVSTVVGVKSTSDVSGCVNPSALWSCEVPDSNGLQPGQPSFRFLIRFRNGTLANETLLESTNNTYAKRHEAVDDEIVVKRSAWSSLLYTSSPPPPSTQDQIFLGRTTDNNSSPYNGEETPFYISLLDPIALQPERGSNLRKRHFRYPYPTPSDYNSGAEDGKVSKTPPATIPSSELRLDGEPLPAELYPFAYAQPLRLFNRGLPDSEHYGFYLYFSRSIYVSGILNNSTSSSTTRVDVAANVGLGEASAVCVFSQSRFLVQIWTQKSKVNDLIPMANASSIPAADSSANDMSFPGSFPYSVTFTLDRHGGDANEKGVYCYGLDDENHVMKNVSTWITEDRAFGGSIVNPAEVPTNHGAILDKREESRSGGVDGGTGGCQCQWQNFGG